MTSTSGTVSPPLPPDPRSSKRNSLATSQVVSRDESAPQRSLGSSVAQPVLHQQQPILEAVDRAFDATLQQTPSDPHVDPIFVAKVAEQVVKHLREVGLNSSAALPTTQFPPSPPQLPVIQPQRWSDESLRRRSPSVTVERPQSQALSPEPALSGSEVDNEDRYSSQAVEEDAIDTSSNATSRSTRLGSNANPIHRLRRDSSTQRRSGKANTSPPVAYWDDMTAVEKTWEPLFDINGHPLRRLGHFLRGLALHLIDDYEPRGSLVVTPAKMARFFRETKLEDEQYPWEVIFGNDITSQSLSTLYQRLLAQHHLVQTANHSSPTVPALTPHGFECFMTCLIQAHPDQEYRRISEAVKNMPISSSDNPTFRFPKELSRRLLPARANVQAAQRLVASMAHDPKIVLKNSTAMPPPPPSVSASQQPVYAERDKQPQLQRTTSNAIDDDDIIASGPIERERKPYVAREGSGKIHEESPSFVDIPRGEEVTRPARQYSQSTVSAASSRNRLSTGPGTAPPMAFNNFSRASGRRSPPLSSSFNDSYISGESQYAGSRRDSDAGQESRRSSRRRSQSGSGSYPADGDNRSKPIAMRSSAAHSFDAGYDYNGMPPPLSSLGTSLPRDRSGQLSYDDRDRRRSAYSAGPTPSDGWTSSGFGDSGYER